MDHFTSKITTRMTQGLEFDLKINIFGLPFAFNAHTVKYKALTLAFSQLWSYIF